MQLVWARVRKQRFASEWISTVIPSLFCSSACVVIIAGKLTSATRDRDSGWHERQWQFLQAATAIAWRRIVSLKFMDLEITKCSVWTSNVFPFWSPVASWGTCEELQSQSILLMAICDVTLDGVRRLGPLRVQFYFSLSSLIYCF